MRSATWEQIPPPSRLLGCTLQCRCDQGDRGDHALGTWETPLMTMIKKSHALLSALPLIGVLVALGGCGRNASVQPGASRQLDTVRIEDDLVKPIVTLTVTSLVQQLYATIYALPQMPEQQACTNERGPHYTLTFT